MEELEKNTSPKKVEVIFRQHTVQVFTRLQLLFE